MKKKNDFKTRTTLVNNAEKKNKYISITFLEGKTSKKRIQVIEKSTDTLVSDSSKNK